MKCNGGGVVGETGVVSARHSFALLGNRIRRGEGVPNAGVDEAPKGEEPPKAGVLLAPKRLPELGAPNAEPPNAGAEAANRAQEEETAGSVEGCG